jgi:flagellar biosynthesis protein FlhB
MSGQQDDESSEKTHEPTQRKLDEARRKGEIPKSADLTTAAAYGGLLIVLLAVGGQIMAGAGGAAMVLLDQADRLGDAVTSGARPVVGGLMAQIGGALAPVFLVPALAAIAALLAQQGLVFTPSKLAPKLSRISPLSNAKQKFGSDGLFEFAKSAVKLILTGVLSGVYLWRNLPTLMASAATDPMPNARLLGQLAVEFLILCVLLLTVIGFADLLWQRASHIRRQRMSFKELRDEMKDSEGDPHFKAERRQRGRAIATNRMLSDVPKADVVIVNPTHYAVALRWDRMRGSAPVCVAKGTDEIAARIRSLASEAGVPIRHDPPTARALHATVEIGQEIAAEHYRAVAAAIRFAEAMRAKARISGYGAPSAPGGR